MKLKESEADFARWLEDLCKLYRWTYYHTFNSEHSAGGFTDYVLIRKHPKPRLVFAELKVGSNTPTIKQKSWLSLLKNIQGVETYLWYETQKEEIERILKP